MDTFAARVIDSRVGMILRARRCRKRAAGFTAASLEGHIPQPDGSVLSLGDLVSDVDRQRVTGNSPSDRDPELPAAIDRALAPLSPSVIQIAKRLQHGTVNAVAKELGISRRQVYRAIAELRETLGTEDIGQP